MAPLILASAVVTQLFGGSAGREGVAVQMSAALSDQLIRPRWALVRPSMLVVAIAAGFGAVFGTPVAGALFALEVPTRGRLQPVRALLGPCLLASLVGDGVTRALGIDHDVMPGFPALAHDLPMFARFALLGLAAGFTALAYVVAVEAIKRQFRRITWPPLRPVIGGVLVVALVGLAGTRDYLGLSISLAQAATGGLGVAAGAFAWKLAFTAVTLGSGFQGGEVTPLFVIGATMAAALAPHIGLYSGAAAMIGFVAVFGSAANTPITCVVLAAEIFGAGALPFAAVALAVATAASTPRSIYMTQRAVA